MWVECFGSTPAPFSLQTGRETSVDTQFLYYRAGRLRRTKGGNFYSPWCVPLDADAQTPKRDWRLRLGATLPLTALLGKSSRSIPIQPHCVSDIERPCVESVCRLQESHTGLVQ